MTGVLIELFRAIALGGAVGLFFVALHDIARAIREVADAVANIWTCTCGTDDDGGDEDEIDNTAPPAGTKSNTPELLS